MPLNRREFLTTSALAVAAASGSQVAGASLSDASWRRQRLELAQRGRRIIYNDDGDARYKGYYGPPPKDKAELLKRRFNWMIDTQVDSYFWCIGDGQEPPWGQPLPEGIDDCNTTMLNAARKAGQEAVISVRMNDIHDAFGTVRYPFKLKNRRLLIEPTGAKGKYPQSDLRYWTWSALDYAFPEVREHKFAYLAKTCAKYAPDGLELDFFRHPAFFKQGEEAKNLPVMTEFVRRIRKRLDEIGKARGKPILLITRLTDTPEKSVKMGLDGPTWLKERLLDVLIVGGGYAPFWTAWTEYRDLAAKHDIPAYLCFNCSLASHFGRVEVMRGIASNWWYLGAAGVYLFNPFVPVDLKKVPAKTMYAELNRLGDLKTLVGLDKVFCQDYFSDNSVLMQRMTADPPLPTAISKSPKTIPLLVGDDLSKTPSGKQPSCQLRVLTEPARATLTVKLNGQDIGAGQVAKDNLQEFEVPPEAIRHGNNKLIVTGGDGQSTQLRRVQLWVRMKKENS